jgi:hypothetical protein
MKEVVMSEIKQTLNTNPEDRQKRAGIWVAGIFSLLGLSFFIYDVYTVFVSQNGRFDFSDKVLMPLTATMFLAAVASLWLIWRN